MNFSFRYESNFTHKILVWIGRQFLFYDFLIFQETFSTARNAVLK